MRRVIVTAVAPDPEAIGRAASLLRAGGVAAVPTDTLYGLAADPFNAAAVAAIFAIKDRASEKALPLVAADIAQVTSALGPMSPLALRLAEVFWPGPLTLVLPAPEGLAAEVTGGSGTVGVRVPAHAVTRALCQATGGPLTATSANVSGQPATRDPEEVARCLGASLELLVDAGMTPGGAPSTIVDVTGPAPQLIRAGAIAWDAVLAASRPR